MWNTWSPQWRLRSRIFPLQRVNSTPSLSYHNHLSVLPTCSVNEIVEPSIDVQNSVSKNPIIVPTKVTWNRHPKWERQLPSKLVIASAEDGETSLKLKFELETTDTGEVKSVNSFMGSRATGEFIDRHYAKSNQLHTQKFSKPIPVYNVDGTLNKAGSITEVVDLILRYWNHSEQTLFAVTGLGKQKLILGHSWLQKHNLEINWVTGEVKMTRCPPRCCSGCRDEAWEERIAQKAEIRQTEAVSDGPVPELHTDSEEEEPEEAEEPIEPGDCIFAIGLVPAPAEIRATFSVSQRLAEAFKRNSEASTPSGWPVPEYLKEFDSVFSKASFDALPESRKWDHAVELIPGEKASNCKVYPLAPTEQKELDQFLKENLETGRIRPLSLWWHLQSFSLRRRMVLYGLFRTIGP